jgi:cytidine deaminase
MRGPQETQEPLRIDGAGLLSRRDALSILALASPMGVTVGREVRSHVNARLNSEALRKLLPSLSAPSQERLLRVLSDSRLRGKVPAPEVESVVGSERKAVEELMVDLLPVAQLYSQSPLSHYRVGAVVRGNSGSLYLGTNIEVPGQVLGFAVHGEQCAVANAFMQDERVLTSIAITAAPCGHCRQFLNELPNGRDLKVLVKRSVPTTLASLLPESFGPSNLEVTERLFSGKKADLELDTPATDQLASAALEAARGSYAPYTGAHSGVAILSSTKTVYNGSYIENAAYNPSLSPLQATLAGLIMAGELPDSISSVVLVELENATISQETATRAVLDAVAPAARLRRVTARQKH